MNRKIFIIDLIETHGFEAWTDKGQKFLETTPTSFLSITLSLHLNSVRDKPWCYTVSRVKGPDRGLCRVQSRSVVFEDSKGLRNWKEKNINNVTNHKYPCKANVCVLKTSIHSILPQNNSWYQIKETFINVDFLAFVYRRRRMALLNHSPARQWRKCSRI